MHTHTHTLTVEDGKVLLPSQTAAAMICLANEGATSVLANMVCLCLCFMFYGCVCVFVLPDVGICSVSDH